MAKVPTTADIANVSIDLPKDVAAETLSWQVIRYLATDIILPSGIRFHDKPLAFPNGYTQRFPMEANTMDCAKPPAISTQVLAKAQHASPPASAVSPNASASDLAHCYISTQGQLKDFDRVTSQPLASIHLPGDRNITSMVSSGDAIYIGVGASKAHGSSRPQLLLMDTWLNSRTPNALLSIKLPVAVISSYDIVSMAVEARGALLALVLRSHDPHASSEHSAKASKILVFDLYTINFTTGAVGPTLIAVPDAKLKRQWPLSISADDHHANRFLVSYSGESKPATLSVSLKHKRISSAHITPPA
ncbi:MAG: hypothetical protein L0H70_03945 [Xanthomonadales bacterium]|nr:hypothetical protein [Xanthomonadales bacterium]